MRFFVLLLLAGCATDPSPRCVTVDSVPTIQQGYGVTVVYRVCR